MYLQGPKGDKGDTIQSAAQVAGDGGVPEGYIQGPPGPPGPSGAPGKKVGPPLILFKIGLFLVFGNK